MNVSTEQRRLFRYLIPEQPSSSVNRAGREVHLGSGRRSGVIVARAGISGTDAQIPLLAIGFPLVSSSRPSKRPVVKTAYQRPASKTRITREGTGSSVPMRKLLNCKIVDQSRSAPSARKPSPTCGRARHHLRHIRANALAPGYHGEDKFLL